MLRVYAKRRPYIGMRSIPKQRVLSRVIPSTLLAAAIAIAFIHPLHFAIAGLGWVAIIASSQLRSHWAPWMFCAAVITALTMPMVRHEVLPDALQLTWLLCLICTCLVVHGYNAQRTRDTRTFAEMLDAAPGGMMIVDQHGDVLRANQHMVDMLATMEMTPGGGCANHNINTLIGSRLWECLATRRAALAAGEAINLDIEVSPSANNKLVLRCHARMVCSGVLSPRLYVIQISDLTRQLIAEHQLRAAATQLRRALASTTDPVLITDQKLTITFANEHAGMALADNASALLGQSLAACIHPEHRHSFMKSMERFAQHSRNEQTISRLRLQGKGSPQVSAHVIRIAEPQNAGYAVILNTSQSSLDALAQTKSSQARFSQIFHGSPDAILVMRAADSTILDFNEGFTRLLGYRREQVIGEAEIDLSIWSMSADRQMVMQTLQHQREVIDHETILKNSDGAQVHVEISLRYIEIDNELCILMIGRDITRRISAEAALVETEEKFEKVFSESPDGIVILRHADGTITDINHALLHRSGYSREEIVGHSIYETQVFLGTDELQETTAELATLGRLANRSITFVTKSGESVPSLVSATVLELSGEAYAMVIVKDISKLRTTEERLRRSEARFRGTFENAPIGIMLVDMEGRIFQANHTAASLLAYDEQHMGGLHLSRLIPAEERVYLKEHLISLARRGTTVHRAEQRMICQNGLQIWTNFNIVVQHNSDCEPEYFIVQIADVTDLKRSQERMEQMAFYDTLTSLANRRLFHERLNQAIKHCARNEKISALLYLDLDNFKRVNDTLGHQIGDNLLREVGSRLRQSVRNSDTVARTGGDEFTILLNDISGPADAGNVAQKILNHLRETIDVLGHPLVVTTSIGITILPSDGVDPNDLMRNADLAMYHAKECGRNNFQFYSKQLNTNAMQRLRTEDEIRQALDQNQFELHYQPQISLSSHDIVGVETLIRWNHPQRGLISPDEFIGVAEDTGSIIDIGTWVIEESCRACRTLLESHSRPLKVAINISPRQFRDPDLVATVRRNLREARLDPSLIELEITETMLMQDVDAALEIINALSELGVTIAIDDFGTGYSSLIYLKRFPIDTVKVDRSFVMDIPDNAEDMAITRAVIAMAHQLKMVVVAEGVETQEQLRFLAKQRCEYAQGWLFSRALPMGDLMKKLDEKVVLLHG